MHNSTFQLPFEPPRYEYEDYRRWDDNWELIDGAPYSLLPSPTLKHQQCISACIYVISSQIKLKAPTCKLISRLDWIVDNKTVVRPDIMIVTEQIQTDYLQFPPSFILEVGSKEKDFIDRSVKYKLYEINGVKYYLLANVESRQVSCFELVDGIYQTKTDLFFQFEKDYEISFDSEII